MGSDSRKRGKNLREKSSKIAKKITAESPFGPKGGTLDDEPIAEGYAECYLPGDLNTWLAEEGYNRPWRPCCP